MNWPAPGRDRDVSVEGLRGADVRASVLVFTVLFVHSLPEGFAIGTAYASHTAGLGAFVILAIGIPVEQIDSVPIKLRLPLA